jgi:hypothetical protein
MRRLHLVPLLAITAVLATARVAAAQDNCVAVAGPDTAVRTGAAPSAANMGQPDLRIIASVSADEVTFAKQPKICVTLRGDARLDSVRVVGRRNIASPVVRGTTYRDVYVAVEILGHLDANCIAARITRAPADSAAGACAALGVRTRSAAP